MTPEEAPEESLKSNQGQKGDKTPGIKESQP